MFAPGVLGLSTDQCHPEAAENQQQASVLVEVLLSSWQWQQLLGLLSAHYNFLKEGTDVCRQGSQQCLPQGTVLVPPGRCRMLPWPGALGCLGVTDGACCLLPELPGRFSSEMKNKPQVRMLLSNKAMSGRGQLQHFRQDQSPSVGLQSRRCCLLKQAAGRESPLDYVLALLFAGSPGLGG